LAASGTDGRGSRAATAWAATGAAGSIARLPARLSAKSRKSSQQDHPSQHIEFAHAFIPSLGSCDGFVMVYKLNPFVVV
jgi:Zn-dependent M28 family amino/carboxypeptidase